MNMAEANALLKEIATEDFKSAVAKAVSSGLKIYTEVNEGVRSLTEWMQTSLESRFLSASVLSAFEVMSWDGIGFTCCREKQSSSHRVILRSKSNNLLIDIFRDGDYERKFVYKRSAVNKAEGRDGGRYLIIDYGLAGAKPHYQCQSIRLLMPVEILGTNMKSEIEILGKINLI